MSQQWPSGPACICVFSLFFIDIWPHNCHNNNNKTYSWREARNFAGSDKKRLYAQFNSFDFDWASGNVHKIRESVLMHSYNIQRPSNHFTLWWELRPVMAAHRYLWAVLLLYSCANLFSPKRIDTKKNKQDIEENRSSYVWPSALPINFLCQHKTEIYSTRS